MSDGDSLLNSSVQRDPVEELAEQFLERRRRGEAVSVSDYAKEHPHLAQRIRDLFPTLLLMEQLKPDPTSSRSGGLTAARGIRLERLGDFHILREIGRGGMGVVYEAEQESLGRHVALKVMPPGWVGSPLRLQRFHREAQAAARLHHTNIVPIFGVGQQDDIHYIAMQFIPGQGLDRVLAAMNVQSACPTVVPCEQCGGPHPADEPCGAFSAADAAHMLLAGPLTGEGSSAVELRVSEQAARAGASSAPSDRRYWRSVARIGVQVADALAYAHRQGTLHRDIKPANLLLDNRGTVWIADFGLAKLADLDDLTRSGDMVGTLRYMAPEQLQGNSDARSDVYSLGLTLYELLTLRPAFDEKDRRRLLRQVAHEEPPHPRKLNPDIPRDLETIVVKAIACDPGHRYQTAGELAADLKCFLEDRPIRARRTTPIGRLWRWCRRNRAVAALAGTALALLMAVAVVASIGFVQSEAARRQAEDERARTREERERAEANLRLAIRAFEDIFSKVAADPVSQPPSREEDEEWPEPAWEHMLSSKDAILLESMLKFYDQFAEQNQADVKLQRETARAYRRVGEIQQRLGQYDKAETAFRHALATYQRLPEASRENSDCLTAIAAIYNELGLVARSTGHYWEARDFHAQAQETLRRQSPQMAALPESRFELARTYGFLSTSVPGRWLGRPNRSGDRRAKDSPTDRPSEGRTPASQRERSAENRAPGPPAGRSQEAIENNRQAVEILRKLTEEAPDNPRYQLAMARSQRDRYLIWAFGGRSNEPDGGRQQAADARLEALRMLEKLVADAPNNPDYRYELAETYAMSYPSRRHGEKPEETMEQFRRAVEIGSELVNRYPTVPEYKASLARSHMRIAEALRPANLLGQAESHWSTAADLQRRLVAEFPAVQSYRFFLIRSLQQLSEIQDARHEPAKARPNLEEAIALSKQLQEASPNLPHWRMMLAFQYGSLAKILRELGEKALADEALAKAQQLGDRQNPPKSPPFRGDRQDSGRKP